MRERLISQVPLFSTLPPAEIDYLARTLQAREFPPGALLFREGTSGDSFFVLLDGQVEIIKALGDEAERLLGVRGAGTFIGEMSLFSRDGLRTASVRARTPLQVLVMTRADFDALLGRQPMLAYDLVRVLSRRLEESENLTIRDLLDKNRQLTRAYEELKAAQAQLIEKEKLEAELDVARRIQSSILPASRPRLPGFSFGTIFEPMRSVGGDFFDFVPLDEDRLGIVVGDVTDHGVPAAIFMALTYSLMRAEVRRAESLGAALRNVNRHLLDINASSMFATVLAGTLNRVTREFAFARAGHEMPIVVHADGPMQRLGQGVSQPLGLFPHLALAEQSVVLPPGSLLVMYTDGVTEAMDPAGAQFGEARFVDALSARGSGSAQDACEAVMAAVRAHAGPAPQHDDILLLAVQTEI